MGGTLPTLDSMAASSTPSGKVADLATLSTGKLKAFLRSQRVDTSSCVERKDLVGKLEELKGKALYLATVRNDLKEIMHDRDWDDGSYAPLLIRELPTPFHRSWFGVLRFTPVLRLCLALLWNL